MPPIAVLAGGLATRMRPLTEKIPKSLLEVAGEPFVAHQLRLFRREGLSKVVLCVGYLSEMLEEFVGDGSRFGLEVVYSRDGEKLLGTGGALLQALPHLGDEFLVTYGDSYLDIPFAPVVSSFRNSGLSGLMTVLHNRGQWDTSNVEFDANRIIDYSKKPTGRMEHIDFGLSALRKTVFSGKEAGQAFDLASVYRDLVMAGQMAGYEVSRRFYEIGSSAGLREINEYLGAPTNERGTT
jgi:NDP-sugar pyrophosphorylase family protein